MAKEANTTMSYEPYIHTPVASIGTSLTQLFPSGDGPGGARLVGLSANNDFDLVLSADGTGNRVFVESTSQGPFWVYVDDMTRIWVKATSGTINMFSMSYHVNQAAPVH